QPVVVRMTDGKRVDGWVMVVVDCWAPLDRTSAHAKWIGTKDGRLGLAGALEAIHWSVERTPRAPLFRLVEAPNVLIAREDFIAKLVKVGVRAGDLSRPQLFAPAWSGWGPFEVSTKVADAAENAYWRLAAGEKAASARASALAHPLYEVWPTSMSADAVGCVPVASVGRLKRANIRHDGRYRPAAIAWRSRPHELLHCVECGS
ncbi:MAG TPA: hypothetical protein VM580_27350, partial [Labilithrix sp.]|nr:hypothetical protein [Labilithrix sp.]